MNHKDTLKHIVLILYSQYSLFFFEFFYEINSQLPTCSSRAGTVQNVYKKWIEVVQNCIDAVINC